MEKQHLYFISKDANWQKYRADTLGKLVLLYDVCVTVLTTGKLKPHIDGNTSVEYSSFRNWLPQKWKPSFFPGALRAIIRNPPDVVMCIANMSQLTELAALFVCKILRIRFVWWTHGYDHDPVRSRLLQAFKNRWMIFLFRQADAVITFSNAGRDYVVTQGLPASKVFCAPNTLDTDRLLESATNVNKRFSKQEIACELGIDANDQFVLFSGRLLKGKRLEDAILAMAKVRQELPRAHLLVIGDGSERLWLSQLAKDVLSGGCSFFGEVFDEDQLAKMFSIAEVFIMPGYVGLAIVHAFCFGLPLITERVENHSPEVQYLHDGYNGYCVDVGDVDGLASHLRELLTDHMKQEVMSKNALDTIEQEANIGLMLRRMATALELRTRDV